MRKGPVVLKPLGSRKSQVSNILGVRRQEKSPAFEVRDQAALDWQKVLRGAPCTVWLKLALIRPSQELLVSYRPLGITGAQKSAVAPRAGAAELSGVAREACDITRVAPAIRSPAPPAQPLASRHPASASVSAAGAARTR